MGLTLIYLRRAWEPADSTRPVLTNYQLPQTTDLPPSRGDTPGRNLSTQSHRPHTLNTDPTVHFWATYVHGHTPHPWPAVPLCLILVVGMASLQNGLVNAATSSHHTDHSSVGRGDDLFGARRQLHSRLLCLRVVGDDCGIVSRGSCQLASVTRLLLQTTHDGALRHGAHREHVADVELGCKRKVVCPHHCLPKPRPASSHSSLSTHRDAWPSRCPQVKTAALTFLPGPKL